MNLTFSVPDYAVFITMMVASFGIGIYHAFTSSNNKEGKKWNDYANIVMCML